jgi:LacI family transcriptional regulator
MESSKRRTRRSDPALVTSREIAREAGVSIATVSRVINQPNRVSPITRQRVLAVVDRHHFVADGLARGLASRRSNVLGLVIPTISNSIYAISTQATQQAAQALGYTVLVGVSEFSPEREAELVHRFIERRVDGLVLTGAERDRAVYDKIARNRLPFVITWKLARESGLPCISFNNHKAAAMVVEYLVSIGHRRIALVCGRTHLNDRAAGRREGFVARMHAHGLAVDERLIVECDFEYAEGQAAMHRVLAVAEPPTAVFCASDILAIGAMHECHQSGRRVPDDVSIVGFDDQPITQYLTPQLTTVRVPAAEMGRRACESLIAAVSGRGEILSVELPTDLVIRGSTAPPP